MLAGCSSSTLLSPRHRLRSEASAAAQFPACHFPMNTQKLDLPCGFSRKESSRSQPIRSVGISVEKPVESKTGGCNLKQNIRLPPLATTAQATFEGRREIKDEFWEKGKSLKRFAEQNLVDECGIRAAKRKKRGSSDDDDGDDDGDFDEELKLGQIGAGNFWFQPCFPGQQNPNQSPFVVPGGEVISSPFPLSNNPWVESVIAEITDFGGKDVEIGTLQRQGQEASGSSNSDSSHSLGLRLNENAGDHDVGNGSGNPYQNEGTSAEAGQEDSSIGEHKGFELVGLLTDCVEAIGAKNIHLINHFLSKLGDLASPRGSSTMSRLIAYYTEALALRVTRLWPHVFHINVPRELDRVEDDNGTALRLLNQVSPIPKFVHFTANEIILRAFEGKDRVHIIDFDIKQGLQWPSLFQSLASRTNPPSHVRITGIGESKQELNETGDRLLGFAEALNLPFEFHPVVDRLEDVRLWMLHVKEKECVAINCMFQLQKTLYDTNGGAIRDFLGLIRSTNPSVVIIAEQEAEHNASTLDTRVSNSLRHYAAIFDSVDDTSLPLDSPVRNKIEEMFAKEIRNIIACEGSDRLERHQGFNKWRVLLEQGGFRCAGITDRELLQSQMLLKMYSCDNYYSVRNQGQDDNAAQAVTLSWLDQPLYTVSAWSPVDVPGSSSSFTQPR